MSVGAVSGDEQSVFSWSVPCFNFRSDELSVVIKKLVGRFKEDFPSFFKYKYKGVGRPKKYGGDELLGFVLYAVSQRKYSCREMADWTYHNDDHVNYLLNYKHPSKSLLNAFILEKYWLFHAFFIYIVRYSADNDLIDGECVFNDGTIFKANANNFRLIRIEEIEFIEDLIIKFSHDTSKNSTWSRLRKYYYNNKKDPKINDLIEKIKNNLKKEPFKLLFTALKSEKDRNYILNLLDTLKTNYDGKHTISLTDPESRWMKDKKGNIGLNYNYQASVDSKNGFILSQYLTQNPTDHHELLKAMKLIERNLGFKPTILAADNAYLQDYALKWAKDNNIQLIIPDRAESTKSNKNNKKPYAKHNFKYIFEKDYYICPEHQTLHRQKDRKQNNKIYKVYSTTQCKTCPVHNTCTKSRVREILDLKNQLRDELKQKYLSKEGQKYYKKRGPTNEGIFGNIKENYLFHTLRRKGLQKAQIDLTIRSTIHNLKKIRKLQHKNL